MKLLDKIRHPRDLRQLSVDQLKELAGEIRERIIQVVGNNGGHLASNLGVTELTIALHYCFDFEKDHLLWDVGHQCYPHKLLTGRNEHFETLRKSGGVSGFPNPDESPFDLFKVGHAGTAIATALGLALADQSFKRDARTVALVGDASIVNGLAFEGLNQAGILNRQFLVVLNDNSWGIAPTQGAMAAHLAKLRTSSLYEEVKQRAKSVLPRLPIVGRQVVGALEAIRDGVKATVSPHQIFEQMGFMYVGPVEGHDIAHLIELIQMLGNVQHPVLLHVHTNKGQGADFARAEPGRFHSPRPFYIEAGKVTIQKGSGKSWTAAFSDAITDLGGRDARITALTAGMPDGTGLDKFAKAFPSRYHDVGIAESAAVDIAAGMAKAGLRPVVAIYSTFLQRAFDQIFQEVVLQDLPVVLCMDRAGLVGGDGAVHHGSLDISYLRGLPNTVLMAPADEAELQQALRFAVDCGRPCAIRYPRADVPEPMGEAPPFEMGRSRLMHPGRDATILAYGATVSHALDAAELLAADHLSVRVINARFAKPIDRQMVTSILRTGHPVMTIEEHSVVGGFGSALLEAAMEMHLPAQQVTCLGIPADRFIPQGPRAAQLAECGLDAAGIAAAVQQAMERRLLPGLRMSVERPAGELDGVTWTKKQRA
ncbi:MAG TPA: 1-deoxy-D-xylulose-5-phosphate synthase [Phycisphaerae bacterium]|nr:1-deoxy-D-xylulose-5-phosphate synthase [Phycisphaerae bacterium]HRY67644.1 1-deoxy-D-xylulose-5-phosphate synthase [Phycisphaerae bacterium]HSA25031.1 1-deoxy-D-xylulose-5-phosphate synthase [Phycisphaerae bacterium]